MMYFLTAIWLLRFSNYWLYYTTLTLNCYISVLKNMGMAEERPRPLHDIAPRAPLLKFLEISPGGKGLGWGGVRESCDAKMKLRIAMGNLGLDM